MESAIRDSYKRTVDGFVEMAEQRKLRLERAMRTIYGSDRAVRIKRCSRGAAEIAGDIVGMAAVAS